MQPWDTVLAHQDLVQPTAKWLSRRYPSETVDDLVSEGNLALYDAAQSYTGEYPFDKWARLRIRRGMLNYIHRSTRIMSYGTATRKKLTAQRNGSSLAVPAEEAILHSSENVLQTLIERETASVVKTAVQNLPTKFGSLLRMYYDEGMLHHEIGSRLGIPRRQVGKRIHKAEELLRKRLQWQRKITAPTVERTSLPVKSSVGNAG